MNKLFYALAGAAVTVPLAFVVPRAGASTSGTAPVQVMNSGASQAVPVAGSVSVSNLPSNQSVSGSVTANQGGAWNVGVNNFPATQDVSGTVGVNNFPATQDVSGSVGVNNFPATQNVAGSVSVNNFPSTQSVNGTVGIDPNNNVVDLNPIIRGDIATIARSVDGQPGSLLRDSAGGGLYVSPGGANRSAHLADGVEPAGGFTTSVTDSIVDPNTNAPFASQFITVTGFGDVFATFTGPDVAKLDIRAHDQTTTMTLPLSMTFDSVTVYCLNASSNCGWGISLYGSE